MLHISVVGECRRGAAEVSERRRKNERFLKLKILASGQQRIGARRDRFDLSVRSIRTELPAFDCDVSLLAALFDGRNTNTRRRHRSSQISSSIRRIFAMRRSLTRIERVEQSRAVSQKQTGKGALRLSSASNESHLPFLNDLG